MQAIPSLDLAGPARATRHPARLRRRALSLAAALAVAALPQLASAASCSFSNGVYSASGCLATLGSGDTLAIVPGGYKYLDTTLTTGAGSTVDATDHLYFSGGNTLNNGGSYRFGSDIGLYDNGASGVFINTGTLAKVGGSGDSAVSISGFVSNGGTVDVQTGRIVFNNGASFNTGSRFIGAGQTLITNGASFSGNLSSNGSLVLAGGTFTGDAGTPARLAAGTVQFTGGALGGSWQTASGTTLNLAGGGYKYVDGAFANGGTAVATDNLYINANRTLTNSGTYQFASDVGLYNNGGPANVVNTGTLAKTGGSGDSRVSVSGFVNNGGIVDVQTGRIVFDSGATFNTGTRFTGAGQVLVTNGATFGGALSTANNLYLAGGTFTANNVLSTGDVHWTGGTMAGTWQTSAGSTLNVAGGGYKYVGGSLTNAGTLVASDNLYVNADQTLTNNGSYQFVTDAGLYNNGGAGYVVNNGTLSKVAGAGDTHISVSGFTNGATGVVDVQNGRLIFDNGATFASGSRFTGAGQVLVTNGATFSGAMSTAGNLYLTGGTFTADNVTATGDVSWNGGTMAGTWQTAAGSTLNVAGGGYKYVGGSLTNAGTVAATDNVYVNAGQTLTNNGRYNFANDAGLYNNGGAGNVVNNGTLAKLGGAGDTHVSVSGFSNGATGVIDVQTGRIVFDNGAVFGSGSRMTGAGQVLVTNGATFNGNLATANNLYLSGGTVTANGVVASGGAHWTSGTMTGQWQSAAGSALSIEGGGYKYAAGLTLAGRSVATDNLYAYGAGALANNGRYEFAGDTGIYGGGELVNRGVIVKVGGNGTSDLSNTALQNLGTLEAQTGTLRLPDNFSNAGRLMGTASLQLNGTLTNLGHIAPGSDAAPGTLTLAGNLLQGAGGTLDIRLASLSLSDLLTVSGSAAIGGSALALSCFACTLQNGDEFLLMNSGGPLTGMFGSVSTSGFGSGFQYTLDYSRTNQVWLEVLQVGAVPEPSTYAMLLAGMGVVGWLARRRRAAA